MAILRFKGDRLRGTLGVLAVLAVAAGVGRAAWRIRQSLGLMRESRPLQAFPPGATARLLIVGDSTAVGTGASCAANSLAGLIARRHPHLAIVNRGVDGARFADIARQLDRREQFDAILVLGGGNDVMRMTGRQALAHSIAKAVELARAQARQVMVMPPGNVGNAPFLFAPLTWMMARRTKFLHDLVRQAADACGAVYVNLYYDKADDPFAQRPDEYIAADGLHPSDAGYRIWYDALNTQAGLANRLTAVR